MKFHMDTCKNLYLGQNTGRHKSRLGNDWLVSSTAEKDLGITVDLHSSQQRTLVGKKREREQ